LEAKKEIEMCFLGIKHVETAKLILLLWGQPFWRIWFSARSHKISSICGIWSLVTVFIRVRYGTKSWAGLIQCASAHRVL